MQKAQKADKHEPVVRPVTATKTGAEMPVLSIVQGDKFFV